MRTDPPDSGPEADQLSAFLEHLALVEDDWFRVKFLGEDHDPDWGLRTVAKTDPDELRERYRSVAVSRRTGIRWDLRWVLLHVVEETARHAGHADLPREAIDGMVGE